MESGALRLTAILGSMLVEMRRVVIDTSVLVAGLRNAEGGGNAVLRHVALGRLIPLVSVALFLEYEEVLKRPEHKVAHGLDDQSIDSFLAAFASASEGVDVHFRWRPRLPDPDDDMVLEAAVNGAADAIVTHNVRDFEAMAPMFGLRVLRPAVLLRILAS